MSKKGECKYLTLNSFFDKLGILRWKVSCYKGHAIVNDDTCVDCDDFSEIE